MSCNFNYALSRVQYADSVSYRRELFDQALSEAEREINKLTDDDRQREEVQQQLEKYNIAVATARRKADMKKAATDWDNVERKCRYEHQQCEQNFPRFLDRVDSSCSAALSHISASRETLSQFDGLLELPEGVTTTSVLDDWEQKFIAFHRKAQDALMEDAIKKAIGTPMMMMDQALQELDRYGIQHSRNKLQTAFDYRNSIKEPSEWHSHPKFIEFLSEFNRKHDLYNSNCERKEIEELLKSKTSYPMTLVDQAYNDLQRQGLYNGIARGRLEEAIDYKLSVIGIEKIQGHPKLFEFIQRFDAVKAKFDELYEVKELEDFLRNTCGDAKQMLSHADGYLRGSVSQALDYYQRSLDKCIEIRCHPKYGRHPKVTEFLDKLEVEQREWKAKVDEDQLKREMRSACDDALTNLSHAKTYFDSGREGQAMDYFERSKDYARIAMDDRRFIGRPEMDEFFDKFTSQSKQFEQYYTEKVLTSEWKRATEDALMQLSHANTYLKTHESQSLEYYSSANEKAAAINADRRFHSYPAEQRQQFNDTFSTRSREFQDAYSAQLLNQRIRDSTSTVKQCLSNAETYFQSHHHGRSLEYLQDCKDRLEELKQDSTLMAEIEVRECVAQVQSGIEAFETKFRETVTANEAKRAIDDANTALHIARVKFESSGRSDIAGALSELHRARDLGIALSTNQSLVSLASVQEFISKFPGQIRETEDQFNAALLANEVRTAIGDCKQAYHVAIAFHKTDPEAKVLDGLSTARDKRDQLANNTRLRNSVHSDEISSYLAEFDREYATFKADYSARILADIVKRRIEQPRELLRIAVLSFDSHRDDLALQQFHSAQDSAGALGADPQLWDLPEVVAFFSEFQTQCTEFHERYNQRIREKEIADAKSKVTTNLSHAKTYFESFRRGQSLEYLYDAKQALAELVRERSRLDFEGWDEWVAKINSEMAAFERTYAETELKEQLNSARSRCNDPLQRVQGSIDRGDIAQALRDLNESSDAAQTFGSDERFVSFAEVDAFLCEFYERHSSLRAAIDRNLDAKRRRDRRGNADQQLSNAKSSFERGARSNALEQLNQARDIVDDIEREVSNKPSGIFISEEEFAADQAFVGDWHSRASEFERNCNETVFNEEVRALLQTPRQHLDQAEFHLRINRFDQALESLTSGKDAALIVAEQPRFVSVPAVKQWFSEWHTSVADFERRFDNAVHRNDFVRARSNIEQAVREARASLDQRSYDRSIESLQRAKSLIDEVRSNEHLLRVDEAAAFVSSVDESVRSLERDANQAMFSDTVRQLINDCEQHISHANTLLNRHAAAQALEAYNTARDEVRRVSNDERYRSIDSVSEFLTRANAQLDAFSRQYAASQLADEARSHVSNVRRETELARTLLARGVSQRAIEHINNARDALRPLTENEMFMSLNDAIAARNDLRAVEAEYASKALTTRARDAIQQAQPHIRLAAQFEEVQANAKACAELDEAEQSAADLYVADSLFDSLTEVTEFKSQLSAIAKRLKHTLPHERKIAGATSSSRASGSSSSSNVTVTSLVGPMIIHSDLRLNAMTLSTDIGPKLFNEIKKYNEISSRINGEVRKAYRIVTALKIDDNSAPLGAVSPFEINTARYPIESVDRDLAELDKWVVGPITKNAPDDANGKIALDAVAAFKTAWEETIQRWKRALELAKHVRLIAAFADWCTTSLKHMDDCMKVVSSNGHTWTNATMLAFDGQLPQKSSDHDVCLQVIDTIAKTRAKLSIIEGEFGGVPGKERTLKKLVKLEQAALSKHPRHCMHRILQMSDNMKNGISVYMQSLRRFPKARAVLMERWKDKERRFFERRWEERKSATGWDLKDPYANQTISDAFEEINEGYDPCEPYEIIAPNDPSLPVRPLKSMKDSKLWTDVHKKHVSKIVFSTSPIDSNNPVESEFKSEFAGSDEIYGRAFWPHAVTQLALAKNKSDGSPVYGPRFLFGGQRLHMLEIFQVVTIDGELQTRADQPVDGFAYFDCNGALNVKPEVYEKELGQQVDYYAFNQTCRLLISRPQVTDVGDDWQNASNRYQWRLSQLPPGRHHVKVDLCFRVYATHNNMERFEKVFPPFNTPLSHPLASGEFYVDTSKAPIKMGSMFPPRKTSLPAPIAAEYERLILELLANSSGWGRRSPKTEQPIYVGLKGNWYCSGTKWYRHGDHLVEEPTEYSLACIALFYRSPLTGWDKEEIAGFDLSAITQQVRGCKPEPPFVGVAVGGNFKFDVDLLPPAVLATLNRCPENLRSGLF